MATNTEHLYPAGFQEDVISFISRNYDASKNDGMLPNIKNEQEAFGILAERGALVAGSAKSANKAVTDMLGSMANARDAFVASAETAYTACMATAVSAIDMAIHAQNIVSQMSAYAGQMAGKTPIESMLDSDEEFGALPDDDETETTEA